MAAALRMSASSGKVGVYRPVFASAPKPVRKPVVCKSYELLAAAGDVDAPVAVPLIAALVVTAVVTAVVPAYLNRGQEAADKIFAAKEKAPLDKGKKTAAAGKKTARR